MWLLPSKGRPESLARFFEAYRATGGSTPGMVIVDDEDYSANQDAYRAVRRNLPFGWAWRLTDGVTQGDKLREIWTDIVDSPWFGLIGDDCVPETAGWDRELLGELDGSNFVSCNDGWQAPRRLANCWIMAGDLVRAVGYIFPPGLHHLFVDDVWEQLANRVRGTWTCRIDIMVRHRHVLKGEAAADETHRAVYGADTSDPGAGLWPTDRATFETWRDGGEFDRAAAAIAALRSVDLKINAAGDEQASEARRMARAKSRSVLICTPCAENFTPSFTSSIINTVLMLERLDIRHDEHWVLQSSNLPKARNYLAARFLSGGWDDLLFIDADMGWEPGSVVRVLASDKSVIGAVGRRKTDALEWCTTLLPREQPLHQDEMGAIEVARVGTGFLKISRDAFERLIAARPDLKRPGDPKVMTPEELATYYQFFKFSDDDGGEDYFFCDLVRSIGDQVWIDPTIELSHSGAKEFTGRFSDTLRTMLRAAPINAEAEAA